MSKTILITGANGFTGRQACRHFAGLGLRVAAVVRAKAHASPEYPFYVCDLSKRSHIERMVERVAPDYVLHLAGRNAVADSWKEPIAFMEINVMSTVYLLDALRAFPDCRIVVAGSLLTFAPDRSLRPAHPYSLSKTLQVWSALSWKHLFQQQVMVAQPSNLIGPGPSNGICGLLAQKTVRMELQGDDGPFTLSSLIEERDYLDVRDAVKAYEQILLHGESGVVYPVGSGENRSLGEVVTALQQVTNTYLPLQVGKLKHYVPPEPVDLSLLTAIGWKPEIAFEQSLLDAYLYFKEQISNPR